jgi:two-component system sensor histidine kinase KdpD
VVAGFLVYDYVFIPPYYTLAVGTLQNWAALGVYVAVMLLVASVVSRLEAARAEARRREEAVRRLFGLTDVLIEDKPIAEVLEVLVSTMHEAFGMRSVALLLPSGNGLEVVARAGEPISEGELRRITPAPGVPAALGTGSDEQLSRTVALSATGRPVGLLGIWGPALSRHDRELMHTFANHLALALERAQLREQALRTELLEKVDRLQRALVSAVSHDLRTPLATIKMAASTLRSPEAELVPEHHAELLGLVDDQADRLDRLVTNLLDLSRVQAGALELRHEPIAVEDLVTDALRGREYAARNARIEVEIPDDVPMVDVDHVLIRQVLANLLDNAVRHAPEGSVVIVSAHQNGDARVRVSVEDEGPGISPSERESLFQSFNRGNSNSGTGLGLSIVQAFVHAHGEDIWVEDGDRGGARFCFTLPTASVRAEVT